jgi:uncharacterized membrane protein YagU involved in acid resistance
MEPAQLSPARAILYGTLVVGTLDVVDAFVFFGLRSGTTPARILQSIASGWLGRAAYTGGAGAAALGAITHYFIAFGIVATYFVVSRRAAVLTRHPIACGMVYGLLVYLFMNRVVIPLSAIGAGAGAATWPALPVLVNGLLIHAFGIGIPSAVAAAAAQRSKREKLKVKS